MASAISASTVLGSIRARDFLAGSRSFAVMGGTQVNGGDSSPQLSQLLRFSVSIRSVGNVIRVFELQADLQCHARTQTKRSERAFEGVDVRCVGVPHVPGQSSRDDAESCADGDLDIEAASERQ